MTFRMIMQSLAWFGVMAIVMFGAAGTLDWPGAWAFFLLMLAMSAIAGGALARHDPALLAERLRSPVQKDQPLADRLLLSLLLLGMFAWMAFMGLDAVRFHWSHVAAWVQLLGGLAILLSIWAIYRTMRANSFAAPVVKIQRERGQTVIDTGPYALVRHPMYVGALLYFAGQALLLGSLWGLAMVPFFAILLVIRIGIEERTLRAALPSYDSYAARVRYRLIPFVW